MAEGMMIAARFDDADWAIVHWIESILPDVRRLDGALADEIAGFLRDRECFVVEHSTMTVQASQQVMVLKHALAGRFKELVSAVRALQQDFDHVLS